MNDGERLAAYLAGELDTEDRAFLEDRLSRDRDLRARLEAIRASDRALAQLGEVTPRAGFSERLRDQMRDEIRAQAADEDTDELAARRRQREGRTTPKWLAPLGAAAAALVLLTVVGVGLTSLGGNDTEEGGFDAALETMGTDSATDGSGPVVVALGRSYTTEDVAGIVDHPAFQQVLGLEADVAEETSRTYSDAFGVENEGATEAEAAPEADDGAATMQAPDEALRVTGEPDDDALADVQRCLPQLFEEAGTVVPVYAEIATFEDEPAIVYGLAAEGGGSGDIDRIEVWVVGRDDCQVRYFTQQDR